MRDYLEGLYQRFPKNHHFVNTKQKIKKIAINEKKALGEVSREDSVHSAFYYKTLDSLYGNFIKRIEETILPNTLEDLWEYRIEISYDAGISLILCHYKQLEEEELAFGKYYEYDDVYDWKDFIIDQVFRLFNIPIAYLSTDQFAKRFNVGKGTVRQWIRRGKIRNAIKDGSDWKIVELEDPLKRGYTEAVYTWENHLSDIPDDLKKYNLNDFNYASFSQCSGKKEYKVSFFHTNTIDQKTKEKIINTRDRERLELWMISNPNIAYVEKFEESLGYTVSQIRNISSTLNFVDWLKS